MAKSKKSKKAKVPSSQIQVDEQILRTITSEEILSHVRPTPTFPVNFNKEEKVRIIARHFQGIMETLGLDLTNDSLKDTPTRIAKMYVYETFAGLSADQFPKMTVIENKMDYDQMVLVQNIKVLSVCEHHFQTIDGLATVAYVPNHTVIGLSKINRLVQFFSRRPQVQERLTKQIADCLQYVLNTKHVAVHINARHYCVIARGVQDSHSSTSTSDLRGHFKTKNDTRIEFLKHCHTQALG